MDYMTKTGKTVTARMVATMQKALIDFGYPREYMTTEVISTYVEHAIAGDKPKGGPEMFVHNWMKEANLV